MTSGRPTVLLVDDETRVLESLTRALDEDFQVITAESAEQGLDVLAAEFVQVVLCDQRMPGMSGVEFLSRVREGWPEVVRIIISGYSDPDDMLEAINRAGIYQFIHKPWRPENLLLTVQRAAEMQQLQSENELLNLELRAGVSELRRQVAGKRERVQRRELSDDRILRCADSPMAGVCQLADKVAQYDIPVLITGETGTGKELMARGIHYKSPRRDKPFVVENCAALPEELLESELFGHKRGAFTGAYQDRVGLFQQADGGTIFLDEIGETSPGFQVKLLRVLQEGEVRPVGGASPIRTDVRVLSATNRNLWCTVQQGSFREDLYYRLSAFALHMPPLRDRREDIPLLANHLLQEIAATMGEWVEGFTDEAMACLVRYHWPGNVRQLQNEIMRMVALGDGERLGVELLSDVVQVALETPPRDEAPILNGAAVPGERAMTLQGATGRGTLKERLTELEVDMIGQALRRHRWNKSRVAEELGLSRVGLRNKLKRYGLDGEGTS
ncbi:sigma-54-dependent transcriptional regulator [Halomonas faecis]|uniref:sigma-54-dependent transcriptional regulator n=1 Tax=Halomonas faecis TaxID=1562110 RepID=UPI0013D3BD28|nr:sigma-54 dependent transcriptional regulator [Halomonas faecis]